MAIRGGLAALLANLAVEIGSVFRFGRAAALLADLLVESLTVTLADDGSALLPGLPHRHFLLFFRHRNDPSLSRADFVVLLPVGPGDRRIGWTAVVQTLYCSIT